MPNYNLSMVKDVQEEEVLLADGILECLARFVQDVMYLPGSKLAAQSEKCSPAAGEEAAQCVLRCLASDEPSALWICIGSARLANPFSRLCLYAFFLQLLLLLLPVSSHLSLKVCTSGESEKPIGYRHGLKCGKQPTMTKNLFLC